MTMLLLNYGKWEILTHGWTAAAKPGRVVEICYTWGLGTIGVFDSSTGVERVSLNIDMPDFLKLIQTGGIVDLRQYQ